MTRDDFVENVKNTILGNPHEDYPFPQLLMAEYDRLTAALDAARRELDLCHMETVETLKALGMENMDDITQDDVTARIDRLVEAEKERNYISAELKRIRSERDESDREQTRLKKLLDEAQEAVRVYVKERDAARRELADALGLLASAQAVREGMPGPEWVRVEDGLPEVNEVGWSDDVLLAYKVIGCAYRGAQMVSRYHYNLAIKKYVWSYSNYVLGDWGYEAYAWMPLPKGPEVSHD